MAKTVNRNVWIDYLRSFITILVVAHHSSLAYTTFAYFDKQTYINSTAPVVDNSKWIGMDIFENFNDIFFMSLMFLVSGLFVYKGIIRKGTKNFLFDRFKRLGLPFIIAVTFIIPIAYLPSFYIVNHQMNFRLFIRDYIIKQQWPVGPPWFIWILLLFNLVAATIPSKFYTAVSNRTAVFARKPSLFFILCFIIVSLAFIPISLAVGQYTWTGFGPFDFQVNRIFLYFIFFLFGACIGSGNWENYLFINNKLLEKPWWFWLLLCSICYLIVELLSFFGPGFTKANRINVTTTWFIFDLFFVASCISSSFAFLAIFNSKINKQHTFGNNLSANAYGIYLIHYVFVTWIQFALLNISIPVIYKFLIVFSGTLMLSWLITNWMRKTRIINNLI